MLNVLSGPRSSSFVQCIVIMHATVKLNVLLPVSIQARHGKHTKFCRVWVLTYGYKHLLSGCFHIAVRICCNFQKFLHLFCAS